MPKYIHAPEKRVVHYASPTNMQLHSLVHILAPHYFCTSEENEGVICLFLKKLKEVHISILHVLVGAIRDYLLLGA